MMKEEKAPWGEDWQRRCASRPDGLGEGDGEGDEGEKRKRKGNRFHNIVIFILLVCFSHCLLPSC